MVERVAVVFFDAAHVPLERFVFKLALNQSNDLKVEEANLELALRSLLIKLSVSEPLTRALAQSKSNCIFRLCYSYSTFSIFFLFELSFAVLGFAWNHLFNDICFSCHFILILLFVADCSWEIAGYFRSLPEAGPSKDSDFWVPADTKQWEQPPSITPIKSMSSEPLCVQLYLEHPNLNESKS